MYSMLENVEEITTEQLEDKLKEGIQLLDVREVFEYEMGHIKEAINIPVDSLDAYQANRSKVVYIICARGNRSFRACVTLQQRGYHCINVTGGMALWNGLVER